MPDYEHRILDAINSFNETLQKKAETIATVDERTRLISERQAVQDEKIINLSVSIADNQKALTLLAAKQDTRMDKAEDQILEQVKKQTEYSTKMKAIIWGLAILTTACAGQLVKMTFDDTNKKAIIQKK